MATNGICSIEECGKPVKHRVWCHAHYKRWHRHGDPLGGGIPRGEAPRYIREVVLAYDGDDCLIWPYSRSPQGYGQIKGDRGSESVHRLVCEMAHGSPPTPKHEAAHSCGKGHEGCCAPRHLSWKTYVENAADKIAHHTHLRGSRQNGAKLTEIKVRQIMALKGTAKKAEIAARFGVHPATISDIHNRRRWGWLDNVSEAK